MSTKREFRQRQLERTHDRIENKFGGHWYVPKKTEAERQAAERRAEESRDEDFMVAYYGEEGRPDEAGGRDDD